jgi:hypothetical protein
MTANSISTEAPLTQLIDAIAATLYTAEHSLAAGLEKLKQLLETSRVSYLRKSDAARSVGQEIRQ